MPKQLNIGQPAPEGLVHDSQGNPVNLSDLWANGPILLTFLRHFG